MSRKDFYFYKQLAIPDTHKEEIIDLIEGFRHVNSFLGNSNHHHHHHHNYQLLIIHRSS